VKLQTTLAYLAATVVATLVVDATENVTEVGEVGYDKVNSENTLDEHNVVHYQTTHTQIYTNIYYNAIHSFPGKLCKT
jgi:hypothetical protein